MLQEDITLCLQVKLTGHCFLLQQHVSINTARGKSLELTPLAPGTISSTGALKVFSLCHYMHYLIYSAVY